MEMADVERKPLSNSVVLVVEDQAVIALDLEGILSGLGCTELHTAGHLAGGVAILDQLRPDAAVLDINIQEEKVYPIAERLDEMGVPFVLVTGHSTCDIPKKWLPRVVLKPYAPEDLGNLLCRLIEAKRR
jgi:two-component SAPR family response regulator